MQFTHFEVGVFLYPFLGGMLMWNLISHFLTFAGGMASGVMLMCLIQTGKLADKEFETMKEE